MSLLNSGGCLYIGQWKPAVNLSTVLASIQQLVSDPNPDDGLVPEITQEFKQDRALYESTARSHTAKHAIDSCNATIRGQQQQQPSSQSRKAVCANTTNSEKVLQHSANHMVDARIADAEADDESEDEEAALQSLWGKNPAVVCLDVLPYVNFAMLVFIAETISLTVQTSHMNATQVSEWCQSATV